ncbi:MAG: type III-A CRISPR-associated RAMP protein Csm3 [Bacteroidetes bacterium]|nr:type III-A CRISPR-associated RAMP protein Csm3 [Bacteroidota bacterium]
MHKLQSKIIISGSIEAVTGLHIGGSKSAMDIGGIDLNVIKTAGGVPFIPGSSLKGKLRSILAREQGSEKVDKDNEEIKELFGYQGDRDGSNAQITRLIFRDALLDVKHFKNTPEFKELELPYSESKWENTINRKTGTAEHPRQLERVPAGARFSFEIVYNQFDDGKESIHLDMLAKAMRILEDDYLGGQGSRGYGKIRFSDVVSTKKTIRDYEENANGTPVTINFTR